MLREFRQLLLHAAVMHGQLVPCTEAGPPATKCSRRFPQWFLYTSAVLSSVGGGIPRSKGHFRVLAEVTHSPETVTIRNTRTHTHTHTHTRMHANTRAHTHAHTHTHRHAHTHTHAHTQTHRQSHTCTHIHTHKRAHTHACTYTHTTYTLAHTYTH